MDKLVKGCFFQFLCFKKHAFIKTILASFIFFLPQISKGQILNVEKDRLEGDTAKVWLGNLGFTFNARYQQVNILTFNSNANLAYLSKRHDYIFISNNNFVKIKGTEVLSDGYAHFRINWFKKNTISWENFTQAQYDQSRGLRERYLVGVGLRLKIRKTEKITLAAGTGLMEEKEYWRLQEEDTTTLYLKSTNYLSFHYKVSKQLNINLLSYYQARLDAFFHPRFILDGNILIPFNKKLAIQFRTTASYDAIPVIAINKLMYVFTGGINYRF